MENYVFLYSDQLHAIFLLLYIVARESNLKIFLTQDYKTKIQFSNTHLPEKGKELKQHFNFRLLIYSVE